MKKILIIGTGWEQIPLVKKAKQYGLYVIAAAWWDKKQIPAAAIVKRFYDNGIFNIVCKFPCHFQIPAQTICWLIAASNKDMYTENENVAKALYYPGTFSSSMLADGILHTFFVPLPIEVTRRSNQSR